MCSAKRGWELAAAGKKNDCDSPANSANGVCVCEMLPFTQTLQFERALIHSLPIYDNIIWIDNFFAVN